MPAPKSNLRRFVKWVGAFVLLSAFAFVLVVTLAKTRDADNVASKKLIVLGIDGMDPVLLRQFMDAGRMPNFKTLAARGSFYPLQTSIPPQSPVAWANIITGLNPGGHGLFDFIHRDPKILTPFFSMSQVQPPKHNLHLGKWVIPFSSGQVKLLRQGDAFWQLLSAHGIPVTVVRIPSNFPPVPNKGNTLAGMGTPDLLGGYGTFSFYTDDPIFLPGPVSGGVIYPVTQQGDRIQGELHGPPNSLRKDGDEVTIPFAMDRDPSAAAAVVSIQDQRFILREKEWSPWIRISFTFIPGLASVSGMCRFYLKQVRPQFELYVTPLNMDPSKPALPISTPQAYSRDLALDVGPFFTQGIAEDTKALTSGLLSDSEFLAQAHFVFDDQRRIFEHELVGYRTGMSFFYFSSLDQIGHMFWRSFDDQSPAYDAEVAARFGKVLEDYYVEMDRLLGQTLQRADAGTTVLVISDHGFAPFRRSLNLNTWLLENGYLVLRKGAQLNGRNVFRDADWTRTRAYAVGLNGLYLNLRGRERDGIVNPGSEADALLREIRLKLLTLRDPKAQLPVVTRGDLSSEAYSGPASRLAPDLIVGYNRGYRVGWDSVLGGVPVNLLEDNTEPWSGDHCIDYTLVPGVVLSNRKISVPKPSLIDIAPTILCEFGITPPPIMEGHDILSSSHAVFPATAK